MSHPLPPPSRRSPPAFPTSVLVGAIRANELQRRKREPYTIERFPALNGGVLLIGYDGRGDVMLELRISASKFSERTIDKMRRWMKANDDAPLPPPLAVLR